MEVLAEDIAIAKELAAWMIRQPGWIKRHQAGATDYEELRTQRRPVLDPRFHIQHTGVVFVQIVKARCKDWCQVLAILFPTPLKFAARGQRSNRGRWPEHALIARVLSLRRFHIRRKPGTSGSK